MTHAVFGFGSGLQQASWLDRPSIADEPFANWLGTVRTADSSGSTNPATATAASGAADAAGSLKQFALDLRGLLSATQEMETGGGGAAAAGTSASAESVGAAEDSAAVCAASGNSASAPTGNSFTAQVVGSDAGYNSSYGYYVTDANGNPIAGQILFGNVKNGGTATISGVDPSHVGFFIIPNGGSDNSGLTDGEPVTFKQVDGQWAAVDASSQVVSGSGANVLFDNAALNGDGMSHLEDNGDFAGNQNWEDTYCGGDRDFNDVDVKLTWNGAPPPTTAQSSTITLNEGSVTETDGSGNAIINAQWASVTETSSNAGDATSATALSNGGTGAGASGNGGATNGVGDLAALFSYLQIQLNPCLILNDPGIAA